MNKKTTTKRTKEKRFEGLPSRNDPHHGLKMTMNIRFTFSRCRLLLKRRFEWDRGWISASLTMNNPGGRNHPPLFPIVEERDAYKAVCIGYSIHVRIVTLQLIVPAIHQPLLIVLIRVGVNDCGVIRQNDMERARGAVASTLSRWTWKSTCLQNKYASYHTLPRLYAFQFYCLYVCREIFNRNWFHRAFDVSAKHLPIVWNKRSSEVLVICLSIGNLPRS